MLHQTCGPCEWRGAGCQIPSALSVSVCSQHQSQRSSSFSAPTPSVCRYKHQQQQVGEEGSCEKRTCGESQSSQNRARQGRRRDVKTRQGKARQGKTRQDIRINIPEQRNGTKALCELWLNAALFPALEHTGNDSVVDVIAHNHGE
jgi:uncharacterized low-complexity protein